MDRYIAACIGMHVLLELHRLIGNRLLGNFVTLGI